MPYVLKIRKGVKYATGRKSRGGCLRTRGNRVLVYDTKEQAKKAKSQIINRWIRNGDMPKDKKKAMHNRITIKKI